MPDGRLKALYLGSNISDLKPKFEVSIKGKNTKMLCMTAQKLFDKAVRENLEGDEEQSYIDFMKYLEVVTYVQKSDDYAKDRTYYSNMIGASNSLKALSNAERLQASLQHRYNLISETAVLVAGEQEQEKKEAEEEEQKRAEKATPGKTNTQDLGDGEIADVTEVSLSSERLFTLLKSNRIPILIMDARPAQSYAESHLTIGQSISVPEEIITAGMSAAALEKQLPQESKAFYGQRSSMDLVVIFDWLTTSSTLTQGSTLYTLKTILMRWDPNVIYKYGPLILEGGYDDWLRRYPMFTTNPRVEAPLPYNPSTEDLLDSIHYHYLDDPPLAADPSILPTAGRPGVDRGSKAAAIQTYEERSKSVSELLEESEKGADRTLELEQDRLTAEKEWEMLRMKKEMEVEGEMRLNLQDREEQLLKNIAQLELSQKRKELENQSLRDQLEEYKKKDALDTTSPAVPKKPQDAEINRRIHEKEEAAKVVAKQREEIAKERLRKVEEDRKKRKLEEDKKKELQRSEGLNLDQENGDSNAALDRSSSASMKRSHSSPFIAQLDDEEGSVRSEVPQFDRTVKPLNKPLRSEINAARQRDFMGVLGRPQAAGLTGLRNLGNTCYMNSVIQCISNTRELCRYFCSGDYRDDVNHHNKTRGEVVEEVAAVVRALWSGEYRSVAPRDLKRSVGQYKEVFRGTQQQDSHEFLFFLINWLHDDLNKRASRLQLPKATVDSSPMDAAKQWREFERLNESLIQALFYGQQKSTLHCLVCKKESSTYGEFNHLSLPLPDHNGRCSIAECMRLYLNGDRVSGWNCPACKKPREAIMKFDIIRLPHILVIHLKRFTHDGWSRKKVNLVEFPLSDLDMQSSLPEYHIYSRSTKYQLYGVSNHYGTMEGGHYTAYCRNTPTGRWFKFDDNEVLSLDPGEVKSPAAYILFYSSVNYNSMQTPRDYGDHCMTPCMNSSVWANVTSNTSVPANMTSNSSVRSIMRGSKRWMQF